MLYKVLICVIASLGAGLGTGFAGLSAAVFISPFLITFLDLPVYQAVSVSLFSDVLASAVSAFTYGREGNLDLDRGRPLLISVIVFAIIGSIAAYIISSTAIGNTTLSYLTILGTLALGINFLIHPVRSNDRIDLPVISGHRKLFVWIGGAFIGIVSGFQGTGGGMMLLFVLTIIMEFGFKPAVGTSVFIMTFTALIAGVTHVMINGMPELLYLLICVPCTAIFAGIASKIANSRSEHFLGLTIGILVTGSAAFMLVMDLVELFLG